MSADEERSNGGVASQDGAGPTLGRRAFVCGTVAAATAAGATTASGSVAAQADPYQGWFEDVPNYEGTVDYRGRDEVTVAVGAGEDGLSFEPAAVLVDPGTTVVWEWTGQAAPHNVVHEPPEDGEPTFESEMLSEEGATFDHTFDDAEEAIYRYFCAPHRGAGMKGAVAVGNVDDELVDPSGGGGGRGGGRQLSTTDVFVAGVGLVVGIALVLAVARPGLGSSDRT
jgi:halocyanin-like protein